MIKWTTFFDNTSTRESLMDFAEGQSNLKELESDCWPKETKAEIRKIRRKFGLKQGRIEAKRALIRNGY